MKFFRIALALAAASLAVPAPAQNVDDLDLDHSLFARVWNILDADRDRHPVIVYVRDYTLIRDTFDDRDIVITGPDAFSSAALFEEALPISTLGGDDAVGWEVRYSIPRPDGGWTKEMNGAYQLNLQRDEMERTDGTSIEPRALGSFQVIIDDDVAAPSPTASIKRSAFPLICDPDHRPESCHLQWSATVEGHAAEGTYIREWNEPHLSSAIQFDENSGVWFVELRAANIPAVVPEYPSWLPWLAVVDLAPPLSARRQHYRFHPEPGPTSFEVRYLGEVMDSATFTAIDGPKLAFAETEPIEAAGTPSSIVTFKFYTPGGIDQRSLGRNFDFEETKPGRPQPAEPGFLVSREEASGWLAVDYEVFAPTGGWTFDDNGTYSIILKEDSIRSLNGEHFPSERSGGFVQISIPDPAIAIQATLQAAPVIRPGVVHTDATVTYLSLNKFPIDLTSIDHRDLRLRGFSGSTTRVARPIEVIASNGGRQVVAIYRIPGPTFGFRAGDAPIEVSLYARQVKTVNGQSNSTEVQLGSIPIHIDPDAPGVFPGLSSSNLTTAGHRPFRFRVRYFSRSAIDKDQLQTGGIMVRAMWLEAVNVDAGPPIWLEQAAGLVDIDVLEGGRLLNATYEITPPEIGWSHLANGPLTVSNVNQLTNQSGDPARAAEIIGVIQVNIPRHVLETPRLQLFSASISAEENRLAAIATVRLPTNEGTVIVTDWLEPKRAIDSDGNVTVFLDATANEVDFGFAGQIPDFFAERHRFVVDIPDPTVEESVVFRINGEELVKQTVRLDQLEREQLLPSNAESVATFDAENNRMVRSILEFEMPGIVIEDWGEAVLEGQVLTANATVRQEAGAGPEAQIIQNDYALPIKEAGLYQFVQCVNGEPVSEVFFHAIANKSTAFTSWIEQQINTFVHAPRRGDAITLLGDLDADGFSDFEEWAFGSDALDPARQPGIDAVIATSEEGDTLPAVRFFRPASVLFHHYRLERSADLQQWKSIPEENYEFAIKNGALQETTITFTVDPDSFRDHYVRVSVSEP